LLLLLLLMLLLLLLLLMLRASSSSSIKGASTGLIGDSRSGCVHLILINGE
jgi:hypothetical protein